MSGAAELNYREIIKPTVQYVLYNPWPVEKSADYNGETYRIPAFNQTAKLKDGSTWATPGELPIAGRPGIVEAKTIVEFIVGPDGRTGALGSIGVRVLFGDERDKAVKKEAHETQRKAEAAIDLQTCRDHEIAVLRAHDAAAPAPVPSQRVMDAYARRQAREEEDLLKASCPACNMGFEDQRAVSIHVLSVHKNRKDLVTDAENFLRATTPAITQPKEVIPAAPSVEARPQLTDEEKAAGTDAKTKELEEGLRQQARSGGQPRASR